jgi:replicative DNA helicase
MDFTRSEISAYFAGRLPDLKQTNAKHWRGKCPIHNGKGLNFSVSADTGMCFCFSQCNSGWDLIGLERALSGTGFRDAKISVCELIGRPRPSDKELDFIATYDYTDEKGALLYQVVRKLGPDGEKTFLQRRKVGGAWVWNINGVDPVPYCLPQVAKSDFVAVVEGEKDVHTMGKLGIVATCNTGGALKFSSKLAPWFANKRVAIFADNDEPGEKHALAVAALLKPIAASVRVVELPGLPTKGDVSDFVQRGGTKEIIRECYRRAVEWSPLWEFGTTVQDENEKYLRTLPELLDEVGGIEQFWNLKRREGIETPWPKITRALNGGLRSGEVYVIAGNQGSGKTSLAMQFVTHAMMREVVPLVFSMEMGWEDLFQRIIGIRAQVDLLEFREMQRNSAMNSLDLLECRERLNCATEELARFPLLVSNKTGVSPKFLLEETTRLKRKSKIGMVVIDHMQLMAATGSVRGDYEKFTSISRATKEVAMKLGIPVILVSQTSRNNSHDGRLELECSDLRGSGAIEEDAAAVILIYPDGDDKKNALIEGNRWTKGPVKTWLKIAKNRYGEQGRYFPFMHLKATTRFEAMA